MSQKNPKLAFIQSIAQQKKDADSEISVAAKSSIKTLQQRPKSYYTLQDVEDVINTLKNKMLIINKETHTEFSKKGLKGLDDANLFSDSSSMDFITKNEFEDVIAQRDSFQDELKKIQAEKIELKNHIEDFQILLDEKAAEISQLQSQSGITSGKVQNQIEELNKLQELVDETQRELKQAKQDREKMESEFETVGNALMTTRLEIEELQTALGNKDIEIENLKSENQILASHTQENIRLKDQISQLEKEKRNYNDNFNQVTQSNQQLKLKITDLEGRISQLEQENEDLLLDSGETSQEAVDLQTKLEEAVQALNHLKKEKTETVNQLTSEITNIKEELSETAARAQNIQNRLEEAIETKDEIQKINFSLERQIEDLNTEIKSKELRIQNIESDRNELRETLANVKLELEQYKSEVIDYKAQIGIKDREIEGLQKETEVLRQRQEVIAQEASDSRGTLAEFEREREMYEIKLRNLNIQINELNKSRDQIEKRLKESQSELKNSREEVEMLLQDQKRLVGKTENLATAVETLRINLAKNPKYAILFVLQDIQQATVGELAKTVAIQLVFAARLMKELESEGWVDFNEDTGLVRLKKPFLEYEQ